MLTARPAILIGSVLQPVILLLAIVLAWPVTRLWALPARLLLAVPMMVLLLVVNVPLGFVGTMQDFRENVPEAPVSIMVYRNDFLQTGGPLALAIAAGILVVSAADRWVERPKNEPSPASNLTALPNPLRRLGVSTEKEKMMIGSIRSWLGCSFFLLIVPLVGCDRVPSQEPVLKMEGQAEDSPSAFAAGATAGETVGVIATRHIEIPPRHYA